MAGSRSPHQACVRAALQRGLLRFKLHDVWGLINEAHEAGKGSLSTGWKQRL